MASAGLIDEKKKTDPGAAYREAEMQARLSISLSSSEMGADQAINIVQNTKAPLDLYLP